MVCSESELRLVELFTFLGGTKSLRKVKLGQLAWGREFDYLIMKFDLISVILRLHGLSTVFRIAASRAVDGFS